MHKTLFELPTDVVVAKDSGLDHENENKRLVCIHESLPFRTAYALITAKLQKQLEIPRCVVVMEPQFKPFCRVIDGRLLPRGEYALKRTPGEIIFVDHRGLFQDDEK